MIPYGHQDITQADIEAVLEVLQSDWLTQGPVVPRFEQAVAQHVGVRHAVAVNSATSALHLACLSLGLGRGDWLWTSPITFVASANCGLYCGAQVDFVDIDPHTFNLCPRALEEKLIEASNADRLPKVIVVVHMGGQSCDMVAIHALSQRYGFRVIEDASHAIGGKYKGEFIGNCRYSDITVFSFHPVKIITTAEGGIAVTNSEALASKMALLRSHGITRDPEQMTQAADGPWFYQQIDLGYNYRMTELQAALGVSQMDRLDDYVAIRHRLAQNYGLLLSELPVDLTIQHPDSYSAYHLYIVRLRQADSTRLARIHGLMREKDIMVNLHYIPVPAHPWYQRLGFNSNRWPVAMDYYHRAITLPLYATLTAQQQIEVAQALASALCKTES